MITPSILLALASLVATLFIAAPSMSGYFWRYVFFKDCIYIRQRHFNVVVAIESLLLVLAWVERPLAFLLYTGEITKNGVLVYIDNVLWSICYPGIVLTVCWRYWIFYCDVNIHQNKANKTWTEIINPISNKADFVLEHISTYGNTRWCGIRLIFIYVALATIQFVLSYY
ncbi:hypothetical protein RFI_15498 [Reticulomyxa filosa]|uniref:Uncharacterized protein n=1 Tax=Reticulomyxa filosa TaxID=46433 RepID=X6N5Y5_RETFI|nr:hypothetical protein RFI_15498 [Reticulomyxa filosa]|eukprot:ETO21705.1 hypothetical protein RFI_15498 [Reticulomyxa filosa]